MLDKRDELIASLAKGLGLVNDAALARAVEIKKRYPQQRLEQILETAGLLTKEGKARLAQAFNQRVRELQAKPAPKPPAKPAPPAASGKPAPSAGSARRARRDSESGIIVPDERDQALLNSLHQSETARTSDPLATPPSEDLTTDSGEEQILAEPTILLPDEELRSKPKAAPPQKAPSPRPAAARPQEKKPFDEELLAVPEDEDAPLELAPEPQSEESKILAEPTIKLAKDDSKVLSESKILAEPTLVVPKNELDLAPEAPATEEPLETDLLPDEPAKPAKPAPGELAMPEEITVGSQPLGTDSGRVEAVPAPGTKKRQGRLERKEFERRSKLRMSFEGMTIGDYEISGELSRGAFGVVLKVKPGAVARSLAKQRGFSGEVLAMKVMLSANDPEETRRFSDEVQVLINLNHPNIVRMFDAGGEGGLQYYAMELIEGVDSRTLVREHGGKLPVLYAARIARDVASALESVHQKAIYHRDLKPANVMIDRASQPYRTVLIDFGLVAKQKTAKGDEGLILGTPSYMPPEQAKPKGGFGTVNATSDIYSLGATFYFLMTGTAPFAGKDPREIIKRVVGEPPADPTTLNAEIPKGIAAICMKCLAKPQRDRYHSAALLVKDLDKELASAQLKLKAKGFMRKIFGGGGSGRQQAPPSS